MLDKKLGPYRITEEIGSGGMAAVYRAYQPSMDRHVAIKVIRATILHDPVAKERFRREARLIARLEHPHLLPVYDFDGDHEPPYIVMRYLEGGTLKQVLAQGELPHGELLVPTLLVNGNHDLSTPLAWARQQLALTPHGKLVVVPGAGHSTQSRAVSDVGRRAVARFLLGP